MGETRAKKLSNRSLKTKSRKDGSSSGNDQSRSLPIAPPDTSQEISIASTNTTAAPERHLTPATLSSRTSHTSLLSSGSGCARQGRHISDTYDPSRIEVRLTPNKGYALFAASTIAEGHVVLAEVPLIRLTATDESRKSEAEEILLERFAGLSKTRQKAFKKLHDTRKDGFSRLRSIYHSNCYNLDGSRSVHGGSCIGMKASRINHSCVPNVQFSFEEVAPGSLLEQCKDDDDEACKEEEQDSSTGMIIFRALKRITKGKEITSNYETIYATRKERQFQLQMHYGFRCDCDACVASKELQEKDDERRLEMRSLRRKVNSVERRLVVSKEDLPIGSHAESYHLRQKRGTDNDHDTTDELVPLSLDCCREMMESLSKLQMLLSKAGLVGIERQRALQEHDVWANRANMRV